MGRGSMSVEKAKQFRKQIKNVKVSKPKSKASRRKRK